MTLKTAAARYARALLDVAVKEQADLQAIERELAAFNDLLVQHRTLEKVLLNPAVPVPRKRDAVIELTRLGGVSPIVTKLLVLLAERDRLALLPELVAAYRDRLLQHLRIVRAQVTTTVPIGDDQANAIERSLAALTGRTVTLETKVDPRIIGGVVARIGSTVYDASVMRQLQRMKQRLEESV
jgi:F-type H+-transporting ATPase subunit delta